MTVIQALINNLMKVSFIETVPSKYINIVNDARDPMFSNVADFNAYKTKIDTCLVANNGVVYVMNEVYMPNRFAAVSAPTLVNENLNIFSWAITADESYITNPNSSPLNAFFSTYLKSMGTRFSFFIPTDEALKTYYDPVSMSHTQPYVLEFNYNSSTKRIVAKAKRYDPVLGDVASSYMATTISSAIINNRLRDMLDAHIVVHPSGENGLQSGNEYFLTKGGSTIKVTNPADGVNGCKIQGGWQLDHSTACAVTQVYDLTSETNGNGNGMVYIINHPIQSTTKSVYSTLYSDGDETSPFYQFFQLCQVNSQVLQDAGLADDYSTTADKEKALSKYYIFTTSNPCLDQNVRFFTNSRFTLYVPTNEGILDAINKGLPTWKSIAAYIQSRKDYIAAHQNDGTIDVNGETSEYKIVAQAMIACLINFVKYHFQESSVFADKNEFNLTDYATACLNPTSNKFYTVSVKSSGNNTLAITDQAGYTRNVLKEGKYNLMARDLTFNKAKESASTIDGSSFAVIHQIDGVLNYKPLTNGRYNSDWNTTGSAKAYLSHNRITH